MNRKALVLALAVATTLGLGLANPAPAAAVARSVSIPVNPNTVLQQDFQGFGTSLAWWANIVGGWSEPNRTELVDLLFRDSFVKNGQTVQGIGLSAVRYNAGASEPGVSYPVIDPHLPARNGAWVDSLIQADGSYDWSVDARQRWVLAEAAKRGVSTFELFGNSAPWWMTWSGNPAGRYSRNSPEGCQHSNLKPEHEVDYANYLATIAQRFSDVGVNGPGSPKVNFRTIEPFNEPSNGWWCWGNNQEGTFMPADQQSNVILDLRSALDSRGLPTEISATDSNNYWLMMSEFDALSSAAKNSLGQVNAHGYAGSDPTPIRDRVQAHKLRFWQSEWGPADWGGYSITSEMGAGLELATRVTNDLGYVRANAWHYWQAIEDSSRGSGPGYWGLIQAPLDGSAETYTIQKQFYVLGQYSKFIRPGALLIDSGNGKTTAAYDRASGKLVLVTYNDTSETLPVTYDLSRFGAVGSSATAWRTSGTENLVRLSNAPIARRQLVAAIPPNSVVTHVVSGVTAPDGKTTSEIINDSNGAFTYDSAWHRTGYSGGQQGAYGLWDQDEHASQSAGATATLRFDGTRVSLFSTVAPSSGKVSVSIDGGASSTLNLYSAARFDGSHVWRSPALPAGRHQLTVRVLGEAGSPGGGMWANIDRVVVEDSSWTRCAIEGGVCRLTGASEVRFGAFGGEARTLATGAVSCSTVTFGNPVVGPKACFVRPAAGMNLVAAHSGRCVAVAEASLAPGAPVIQWDCTGGTEQRWTLSPVAGGFHLSPVSAPSQCLDVSGASTADGAAAIQWTCGTGANQTWKFQYERDGYYSLHPGHATSMCLDVSGANLANGAPATQYTCNGYSNQLFKVGRG